MFPCADMRHWIFSCTDTETMTLSSGSGTKLPTFWGQYYDEVYQIAELVTIMKTPFILPNNSANSKDILKKWVKETTPFKLTPNQIYMMKIMEKVCQYLVIFACQLCGQEST